ncbi:GNAT family N-acetyltransferase [Nocardiopsis chromatogenes]|uniref:GNAT family N-acetyltransferase n=1 Tax=Nocardiopsis chromatogenes TaxID=280239 RepID=UPI0006850E7D|nr:GNAT family N-acetyltransferase [Nocardiopsis chromatogenes]
MQTSLAAKTTTPTEGHMRFRYLGTDDVEELADLWSVVHEQHTSVAPALQDVIASLGAEEAWRRRRAQYRNWLTEPSSLAVLAERGGVPVGYAMVTVRENPQGSWDRGERVAVVQTLAIHPEAEGTGVGSGLLDEIRLQVAAQGVRDIELSALAGSSEDIRFFEREGFRPFVTTMVCRIGGTGARD